MLGRLLTVLTVSLGVLFGWAGPVAAQEFTYSVATRGAVSGDLGTFRRIARQVLNDIRGWSLNRNVEFTEVASGGGFQLILASPQQVAGAAPICSAMWSCRVGDLVLINDDRWQQGTAAWPRSLDAYRRYVINHEVGHWLGLPDVECPGPGRAAPVMMQQSISLDGCRARVWPLFWERAEVAGRHGVGGWPVPPVGARCTIVGTRGDDTLQGTGHADVICGRGGDDIIMGGGGFDAIRGGWGHDDLRGGARDDVVVGRGGNDRMSGGNGADELRGGPGRDFIRGDAGDDLVVGGSGADVLHGVRGDDVIRGWRGPDRLVGWAGDDRLFGRAGHDVLRGGPGADLLNGGPGTDRCEPGPGGDVLRSCEE